jgi:hypothetical protein
LSPPLRWNLGGAHEPPLTEAPEPVVVPRPRHAARLAVVSVLYVAALIGAAAVGFSIGRWSEARRANLGGIANQLAIETVAWQDGDASLYRTILDPDANAVWQAERLAAFEAAAPAEVEIDTLDIALTESDGADVAEVTVVVRQGPAERVEHRRYRASGGSWYLFEVSSSDGSTSGRARSDVPSADGSTGPSQP